MIESLICLLLVIVARITVGELAGKFDFLVSWEPWLNGAIVVFAVITLIFIIVKIIKTARK